MLPKHKYFIIKNINIYVYVLYFVEGSIIVLKIMFVNIEKRDCKIHLILKCLCFAVCHNLH